MESKYTHKFIIYNKKRIKNNYKGLIEKLANFDKEAIPKYQEFDSLIVGIDYFNGEEEYIEKYFSHEDSWYFGGPSRNFYIKLAFRYYYGLWGTELDIFLKNIGLEHLI